MAIPTTVNSQITDAATALNRTAQDPFSENIIEQFEVSFQQMLAAAMANALSQSQQSTITLQAVTTMGAALLLQGSDPRAAVSPESPALAQKNGELLKTASAAIVSSASTASSIPGNSPGKEPFPVVVEALRSMVSAFVASQAAINREAEREAMEAIRVAATAACLAVMIRAPDQFKAYQCILATIQGIGPATMAASVAVSPSPSQY